MVKKYVVTLTDEDRQTLRALISAGKGAARRLAHARILLKADRGHGEAAKEPIDEEIAKAVEVSRLTVERVRKRFVEEGMEAALNPRRPEKPREHKLDGCKEARLIALACGTPLRARCVGRFAC